MSGLKAADVGLVHERADQHVGEVGFLKEQLTGLNERSLLDRQGIDDTVKRCADAGFAEGIFGGIIGGLCFRTLSLNSSDFGLGVAVFLFLLDEIYVGLGPLQIVFGLVNFARRCGTLLLQTTESVEIALGQVECAVRLYELRIQSEQLFLRATGFKGGLIGLCGLHVGLSAGGLRANIGVVELQQELAFAHTIAFLDQQAFHRGCDGGVRFEIPNGLNLAVSRDETADGTALHRGGTHLQRGLVKIGIQDGQEG